MNCYGLPVRPLAYGTAERLIYVLLRDGAPETILAGLAELRSELLRGEFESYIRLEPAHAAQRCEYFGPARFVQVFNPFPADGGDPWWTFMLHIGVYGWVPMPETVPALAAAVTGA